MRYFGGLTDREVEQSLELTTAPYNATGEKSAPPAWHDAEGRRLARLTGSGPLVTVHARAQGATGPREGQCPPEMIHATHRHN